MNLVDLTQEKRQFTCSYVIWFQDESCVEFMRNLRTE